MRNLALIPIRTGSKRLKNKNTREFFGKPIFLHTLEHARESGLFDTITVSTESEKVARMCEEYGFPVPFMRPPELATDKVQLVDVVSFVLGKFSELGNEFDNLCMLWATAPMRTADNIREAYMMFEDDTDAVVGVTEFDLPVFCALQENKKGFMVPLFEKYHKLPRSKQPQAFVDNSSMCWVRVSAFQKHGTWLPPNLKGYWMPRCCSVDIDSEEDWKLAEYYYKRHSLGDQT